MTTKPLAVLLVAASAVTFAACGGDENAVSPGQSLVVLEREHQPRSESTSLVCTAYTQINGIQNCVVWSTIKDVDDEDWRVKVTCLDGKERWIYTTQERWERTSVGERMTVADGDSTNDKEVQS